MKTNATVFLIDNDADDCEIFAIAVREINANYQCVTATSGIEALERLSTCDVKPDCIVLDLNMPQMNGRQCLAEIKKQPALREIPVIVYTTSSESWDKEQLLSMGAAAFVTKAPEIDEIIALLTDVFYHLE